MKPLRYAHIVTHGRAFLAVSGIWITACCIFIVLNIHVSSYGIEFRSFCDILDSIHYFTKAFAVYLPLILIFLLNFHLLSIGRKQRTKRILAETTIASADNSTRESTNRMSFVLGFLVALKSSKTFAIVVTVLTICILTPTVVARIINEFICTDECGEIYYAVFHYDPYGINSVVNAFIYGMRHVKYRKAYLHILFKLFPCHKANKWEVHCWSLSTVKIIFDVTELLSASGEKYKKPKLYEGLVATAHTELNILLRNLNNQLCNYAVLF